MLGGIDAVRCYVRVGLRGSPQWRSCAYRPSFRLHFSTGVGARLQLADVGNWWRVVAGRRRWRGVVTGVVDSATDSGLWRVVASSGDKCRGVACRGEWWQVVTSSARGGGWWLVVGVVASDWCCGSSGRW